MIDLMSVTTSCSDLETKYEKFAAPTVEVEVASTKLVSSTQLIIKDVEVELTSGYEASGATFTVVNAYEQKNSDFSSDINKVQLGESVSISLGYITTEEVFSGYVSRIDYQIARTGDVSAVRVECMDAKGMLMKNRRLEMFEKKTPGSLIKQILGEKPVADYLDGMDITEGNEEEIALRASMLTDYEIIVEQAKKHGYEFFIIQGKAHYAKRESVSSSIMTLTPMDLLYSARLILDSQKLVKTVEVRSIDGNSGELVTGEGTISGTFSSSSSGNKMLGTSKQVFYEAGVVDNAEAVARATARVEAMAATFGEIECECVGIPEIGPARFIELDRVSEVMNKKYYITYVKHTIGENGFTTTFKGGLKSL
ncbi:MAG: hypothetical protein R3Y67_04255 [Eubacteriales bacterium]